MSLQILPDSLKKGARIQIRVIGALVIRELHTRFGRDNIGYLWFIVEPLLLATGVAITQTLLHMKPLQGIDPIPFDITGYVCFMMFRSNVNRAASTVLSNRVLMYHRQVTMFDLILARTTLEFVATLCAMTILLTLAVWLGLAKPPAQPLLMMVGMLTMYWFSTGLSLVVCAAGEFSTAVDKLVHPATYLVLPFSGMLFRTEWLPEPARSIVSWFPLPQIIDIVRVGMFDGLRPDYINPGYLAAWCSGLTLLGLAGLGIARSRVEFE